MRIDVSFGEAIDKLTILWIKSEKISSENQLVNINREIELVQSAIVSSLGDRWEDDYLQWIVSSLSLINKALWQVEDDIRVCEREQSFEGDFINLARNVYKLNDERADLKRRINQKLGSELMEEKSYEDWNSDD